MASDILKQRALYRLIPHIFLPPKLPQKAQGDDEERDTSLLLCQTLKDGALECKASAADEKRGQWDVVVRMLDKVADFLDAPMSATRLVDALAGMDNGGARTDRSVTFFLVHSALQMCWPYT